MLQCNGITKKNTRCLRKISNKNIYCHIHYNGISKTNLHKELLIYIKNYKKITDTCCVCFEEYNINKEPILECKHKIHINCIKKSYKAMKKKPECPMCRKDLSIFFPDYLFDISDISDISGIRTRIYSEISEYTEIQLLNRDVNNINILYLDIPIENGNHNCIIS